MYNQSRVQFKQFDSKNPTLTSSFFHQSLNKNPPDKSISQQYNLKNRGSSFNQDKMPSLSKPPLPEKWSESKVNGKVNVHRKNPSLSFPSCPELRLQEALFLCSSEAELSVPPRPKIDVNYQGPTQPKDANTDKDMIFVKTRSRAQKIYSNLKNMKQPISPGARFTSLIGSLFEKDAKPKKSGTGEREEGKTEICSSMTSCLSRRSRKKTSFEDGVKQTVRFCPVGVINGADFPASGEQRKKMETEDLQKEKQRQLEEMALDLLNGYWDSKLNVTHNQMVKDKVNHDHDGDHDGDHDDGSSCSSSDLFELDHLSLIGDEFPTNFDPKLV